VNKLPLKSFRIENKKTLGLAECSSVPSVMIIAGINGSGKSTLLYSIKTKDCTLDHTGKFLYIPPHRGWSRQSIQARFLWEQRQSYEDATSLDSLRGSDGVRITSAKRTADSSDESTKFIKFSLCQMEIHRQTAIAKRFDNKKKGEELDFPDIYQPLKELTKTLLPHLEFVGVNLEKMNDVRCIWKRAEGIDINVGTPIEIDIDDLSSGEKEIFTLFMPFIEQQIERKLLELQNKSSEVSPSDITVLIDEPELHLHPILEARVLDYIRKIVSKDSIQFVITTHSPTILNSANFDELYLLSPKKEPVTNQLKKLTNDEQRLEALRILCGDTYPLTASRNLLCIEGELPEDEPTKPPDKKLYEILCPEISNNVVIPLGGKQTVIESARRLRANIQKDIPEIKVFALVDRDQDSEINEEWLFRLPVCMIENLLIHPEAINIFLEPYREKTQLKNEQNVKDEIKKITEILKTDEIRIRIKRKLGRINESIDGITLEEIKKNHAEILESIKNSIPNDSILNSIIEEATSEVNEVMKVNKELSFFRGKEILRKFYDLFIKNPVGISYFAFCMELAKQVVTDDKNLEDFRKVVEDINSK